MDAAGWSLFVELMRDELSTPKSLYVKGRDASKLFIYESEYWGGAVSSGHLFH